MTGTEHCFLVEWYQRGPVGSDTSDVGRRLAEAAGPTAVLDVVLVVAVPADETVFGVVRADTADAVAALCRAAGWPADRITPDVSAHVVRTSLDSRG